MHSRNRSYLAGSFAFQRRGGLPLKMAKNKSFLPDMRKENIPHFTHRPAEAESVDSHPERLGTVALQCMGHPKAKLEHLPRARLHECIRHLLNPRCFMLPKIKTK